MPTENEVKFVLKTDCESLIAPLAKTKHYISQGYLVASRGVSLRVRKSVVETRTKNDRCQFGNSVSCETEYHMTFKHSVKGRVIEIEKKIDQRDFDDLWEVSMNKLEKVRYKVTKPDVWEIDFFKDHHDHTYFAMAEFEMPEGQKQPTVVPDFITKHLIHEVPLTDTKFSSKLLADVRYATDLYGSLVNEKSKLA